MNYFIPLLILLQFSVPGHATIKISATNSCLALSKLGYSIRIISEQMDNRSGFIEVKASSTEKKQIYLITNRNLDDIFFYHDHSPRRSTSPQDKKEREEQFLNELSGKKVLDLGTGSGQFVVDLRHKGIDAIGIDVNITDAQRQSTAFYQATAQKLPFKSETFDSIFSTFSIFYTDYSKKHSDVFLSDCLRESARVLKNGGTLRIADTEADRIKKLLSHIPELEIIQSHPGKDNGTNFILKKIPRKK